MRKLLKGILSALALLATVLSADSCKIRQIRVDSYKIESVVPAGLKCVNAVVGVVIDNPSIYFMVSDIDVKLYRNGMLLGTVLADPLVVNGKSFENHHIVASVNLAPDVNVFQILGYVAKFDASEYVLDIKARASIKGGGCVRINKRGVPLEELLKKDEE